MCLLQAGGALREYLELLLRSVLSKMQAVQSDSVMQSLLLVFAHIMQNEVGVATDPTCLTVGVCAHTCTHSRSPLPHHRHLRTHACTHSHTCRLHRDVFMIYRI